MLGISHLVVYSMAREIHSEEEAKRQRARYNGFAEANAGSPQEFPDDEGWMSALGRRLAAVVAASVAVLQRL